jgi:hypothetical protein
MTHDLFKTLLDQIGVKLLRVEVTDIRENTYYATLHMEGGGKSIVIDSRPSDAIAIAMIESGTTPGGEKDKWEELLEKMDPEDFSKYKM